jgi:hypothetical protein
MHSVTMLSAPGVWLYKKHVVRHRPAQTVASAASVLPQPARRAEGPLAKAAQPCVDHAASQRETEI